jgi:hypothetical protein
METQELYNKGQNQNSKRGTNNHSTEPSRYTSGRNQNQREVRGIQYQQNPAREHYYRRSRRNNYTVERENGISNAGCSMPDSQFTSAERSLESKRATSPRRNDQQHSGNYE